jgi:hypothetical protein
MYPWCTRRLPHQVHWQLCCFCVGYWPARSAITRRQPMASGSPRTSSGSACTLCRRAPSGRRRAGRCSSGTTRRGYEICDSGVLLEPRASQANLPTGSSSQSETQRKQRYAAMSPPGAQGWMVPLAVSPAPHTRGAATPRRAPAGRAPAITTVARPPAFHLSVRGCGVAVSSSLHILMVLSVSAVTSRVPVWSKAVAKMPASASSDPGCGRDCSSWNAQPVS